jgi:hypothetical protein
MDTNEFKFCREGGGGGIGGDRGGVEENEEEEMKKKIDQSVHNRLENYIETTNPPTD